MSFIYAYRKLRLLDVDNLNKPINEFTSTRYIKEHHGKSYRTISGNFCT
jgi:hypothetical protein